MAIDDLLCHCSQAEAWRRTVSELTTVRDKAPAAGGVEAEMARLDAAGWVMAVQAQHARLRIDRLPIDTERQAEQVQATTDPGIQRLLGKQTHKDGDKSLRGHDPHPDIHKPSILRHVRLARRRAQRAAFGGGEADAARPALGQRGEQADRPVRKMICCNVHRK